MSSSLLRSSAVMALGSIVSRGTGFLRTAVIVAALGTMLLGDAYNTANTTPNIVYDLLLGGILTSVLLPQLVRARERDPVYGAAYEQRLFTLVTIGLAVLSVIAVICAPLLIDLYGQKFTPDQRDVAIIFARFFLPQIFFYGVGAFAGAILNARGRFAAPMWAPVLNNIVLIVVGLVFISMAGSGITPSNISDSEINLIAMGTTGGIVLQTVALWPSLRAVGFRWRPRLDFQRGELSGAGQLAFWTLAYAVAMQVGLGVNTNLANGAGTSGQEEGIGYGVGYTPYFNAYQLFQLPYAIVAVSVITALLPRMSEHAAQKRFELVRDDFSSGLRLSSTMLVPAAALMFALGSEITVVIFAHGNASIADALMMGDVLKAFALGLLPFSIFQLLLRVFYAMGDTRTPALFAVLYIAVTISVGSTLYFVLPTEDIVIGLAAAIGLAYAICTVIAALVVRRRLGRLDASVILLSHSQLVLASVPAFVAAYGTHLFVREAGYGFGSCLIGLTVGSVVAGVLFVLTARLLKISEVETLYRTVMSRLPGRVSN